MTSAPETRTAPIALWRVAEAFLTLLHNLFGAPEEVAQRHTLTRPAYELMASWIRVGEALMRRLLLIEAAALAATPAMETAGPARASPRQKRMTTFSPDAPQDWRVSFRCFSRAKSHRRRKQTRPPLRGKEGSGGDGGVFASKGAQRFFRADIAVTPGPAPQGGGEKARRANARFHSAWPLAERYEALLRVFNAPLAFARRLARQLAAAPARIAELLRAPPDYARRVDGAEELTQAAERSWERRDSS